MSKVIKKIILIYNQRNNFCFFRKIINPHDSNWNSKVFSTIAHIPMSLELEVLLR